MRAALQGKRMRDVGLVFILENESRSDAAAILAGYPAMG